MQKNEAVRNANRKLEKDALILFFLGGIMEKKKLFVLTGFLGAGKTSFLQHVLEVFSDKKLAVIQNEF